MTPGNDSFPLLRLAAGGVLLTGVLLLAGCKVQLYAALPESEANAMLAILLCNDISSDKVAEKKGGTFALYVERTQLPAANDLLTRNGFPKEKFLIKEAEEGLVHSSLEERARMMNALELRVQEMLSQIDGVVAVRVRITLSEKDSSDQIRPSSAAVLIKHLPDSRLPDLQSTIKQLVEKSVEGLRACVETNLSKN